MKTFVALPLAVLLAAGFGHSFANEPSNKTPNNAEAKKLVKPAGLSDRTTTKTDGTERPVTRDWAQVDTNKDHSISPEEMEAYLKANPGPLKGK